MRLRRADCSAPGLTRRRAGRGFTYRDEAGERIDDPEVLERIRDLVIPPAWTDVWICPHPGGHIQATGTDAAGRRQYLYHPQWRRRRDQAKFDHMLEFARALPRLRRTVDAALDTDGLERDRVLACTVRLLDRGLFRIGGEVYAAENDTYGLATMRKEHVQVDDGVVVFDYPAKHTKRRVQAVVDPVSAEIVAALRRRRGGGDELFAYKHGRRWVDVRSDDINAYLKHATAIEISAKDFRTWGATVLAAVALAVVVKPPRTASGRDRAIRRAIAEVARYLGNTPAVARASYVDPRVLDRFREGRTINVPAAGLGDLDQGTAIQGPIERSVIRLIG